MNIVKSISLESKNRKYYHLCFLNIEIVNVTKEVHDSFLKNACSFYCNTNIFGEHVFKYNFQLDSEKSLIEIINNILTNKTFAMLYVNDDMSFLSSLAMLRLKYLDCSRFEI